MDIQEALEKARAGGYTPYPRQERSCEMPEQLLLDTSFWEALGRTMGWEGECEDLTLQGPNLAKGNFLAK